jgi:hypothetical protein
MATVLGQNCCYFLKSFGTMYLQGGNSRTCFLEEFHCYDMENKKHQVRQTQPFPDLGEDLDNFSVGFWCLAVGVLIYKLNVFRSASVAYGTVKN